MRRNWPGFAADSGIDELCDLALSALDRQGWISVEERLPRKDEVLGLMVERESRAETGAWLGKVIGLRGDKVGPANFYWYGDYGQVLMDGDECGFWQSYPDWRTAIRPPPPHASAQTGEKINEPPQEPRNIMASPVSDSPTPASGSPDEK